MGEMKNKTLSFSFLNGWCDEMMGWQIRNKGTETLPTEENQQGIELHSLLANRQFEEFREVNKKQMGWNKDIIYEIDPEKLIEDFDSEVWIKYGFDGYTIRGKIDLIKQEGNVVEIGDIKTSRDKTVYPSHKHQLWTYSFPYLKKGLSVNIFIYFARYGIVKRLESLDPFTDTEKIEKHLRRQIERYEDVYQRAKEGKRIYSQPSRFCRYCPMLLSCPDRPKKMPVNQEEAENTLLELMKGEQQNKARKKLLKSWVNVNGKITADGKILDWHPVDKWEVDVESVFYIIKNAGLNPFSFIKFSKDDLKKMQKSGIDVSSAVEIKPDTWFGVKNAKKEE